MIRPKPSLRHPLPSLRTTAIRHALHRLTMTKPCELLVLRHTLVFSPCAVAGARCPRVDPVPVVGVGHLHDLPMRTQAFLLCLMLSQKCRSLAGLASVLVTWYKEHQRNNRSRCKAHLILKKED